MYVKDSADIMGGFFAAAEDSMFSAAGNCDLVDRERRTKGGRKKAIVVSALRLMMRMCLNVRLLAKEPCACV